jgi:hypothetical protein
MCELDTPVNGVNESIVIFLIKMDTSSGKYIEHFFFFEEKDDYNVLLYTSIFIILILGIMNWGIYSKIFNQGFVLNFGYWSTQCLPTLTSRQS